MNEPSNGISRRCFLEAWIAAAGSAPLPAVMCAQGASPQQPAQRRLVSQVLIPKQSGRGVILKRDQKLKVVNPRGKQVGDLFAFRRDAADEFLSPRITMSRNRRIYPEIGKPLYSNKFNPMLMLDEDTCGVHDLLYQACDDYLYRSSGRLNHPNCRANLNAALRELNFTPVAQPDPHNLFQNSPVIDLEGHVQVRESTAKPGDYVLLRALEDLVVVVTACSVDTGVLNGSEPKELLLQIYE